MIWHEPRRPSRPDGDDRQSLERRVAQLEREDDFYRVTSERCRRFDDLCVAADRDPTSIRHSLVCFPALTPWESAAYFEDMVGRMREVGIDELVLYSPRNWRQEADHEDRVFEEVTEEVIPRLRAS